MKAKSFIKGAIAAAFLGTAAAAPAQADGIRIHIGPRGGVSIDLNTGHGHRGNGINLGGIFGNNSRHDGHRNNRGTRSQCEVVRERAANGFYSRAAARHAINTYCR